MSKTLKDRPVSKNEPDRDGLKKVHHRPTRSSVRNKLSNIDLDSDDLEWYDDEDLPSFEKM